MLTSGINAEKKDYSLALAYYQQALELFDIILNQYPSSELALDISLGNKPQSPYELPPILLDTELG